MKKGFTLIELMIVVVIIGILAAVAIPKFSDVADSAKESSCRANMNTLSTQEAMWMAVNSDYTNSLTDLGFAGLDCPSTTGADYVLTSTPDGVNIAYTVTCGDDATTSHGAIINGLPNW